MQAKTVPRRWKVKKNTDPATCAQFPYKVVSGHGVLLALVTVRQYAHYMRAAPELIDMFYDLRAQGESVIQRIPNPDDVTENTMEKNLDDN